MEDKENFKFVQIAGTLQIPGIEHIYCLLHPRPVEKDTWMDDGTRIFYVAEWGEKPRHIVVNGPFVLDYELAGSTIQIKEEKAESYFDDDEPEWLQKELKSEPASLAE